MYCRWEVFHRLQSKTDNGDRDDRTDGQRLSDRQYVNGLVNRKLRTTRPAEKRVVIEQHDEHRELVAYDGNEREHQADSA